MDYNSLNNLTKEQLINRCRELGIRPCNQSMTKDKIIRNILMTEIDELSTMTEQMDISDDEMDQLSIMTEKMDIIDSEQELKRLDKKELIKRCREMGIQCNMCMTKKLLIELILYETETEIEYTSDEEDDIPGWIQDLSIKQLESIRRDLFDNFTNSERMFWVFWEGGNIEKEFPVITENNKERFKIFFTRYLEKLEE